MKNYIALLILPILAACSSGPVIIPDGGSDREQTTSVTPGPKPERPEPEKPNKPEHPSKPEKEKSNASGNNGKGGNYLKTGHANNGKGKQ